MFDNCSEIKRKFLKYLDIDEHNLPTGFNDKIGNYRQAFIERERAFGDLYNAAGQPLEQFCIKDVVGTHHARYAGKTWIAAFLDTNKLNDRMDGNLELFF